MSAPTTAVRQKLRRSLLAVLLSLAGAGAAAEPPPLFDVHLHYSASHTEVVSPDEVLAKLERNGITRAVFASSPNDGTLALHTRDPERIVPFASLYRNTADKQSWPLDPTVPARLRRTLAEGDGIYRGIGEMHLFAWYRESPVFHQVVDIAAEHGLILMVHGDPAIIDAIFERAPMLRVIWAHASSLPYPALVSDYLDRHEELYIDTSVRDGRIAPDGRLDEDWLALFRRHPDRVMVGVDTFSPRRWEEFDAAVTTIRDWLAQLPPELERKLRHDNAARLFGD